MDRAKVCEWIRLNWHELQEEAVRQSAAIIRELTAEDIINRFMAKGERYGPFDPASIDTIHELSLECMDIPGYLAIRHFQNRPESGFIGFSMIQ